MSNETDDELASISANEPRTKEPGRNLVAFWLLGLCNNFGYVVMLSAAYDILKSQKGENESSLQGEGFHCNKVSTGLVLLADIFPTLIIKLMGPFIMQRINYQIRVLGVIIFLTVSLLTVSFSSSEGVSLLGVVFASISAGAGEITFLSISVHFQRSVVSTWSSGTGMAGVAGALSYAGLTQAGLSSRNTLLVLLIVPAAFTATFWLLLKLPDSLRHHKSAGSTLEGQTLLPNDNDKKQIEDITKTMPLSVKFKLVKPLLKYMAPLFIVYLAEYTINQGLFELLYYDKIWLSQAGQYRWFQVVYQIGVLTSRSSVNLFQISRVMIPALLQCLVLVFLLLEVCYTFIPSFWVTVAVIFVEGLLGGSVYVNTFYRISQEVSADIREFSMGVASLADSAGITVAAFISMPIHNTLCAFKLPK